MYLQYRKMIETLYNSCLEEVELHDNGLIDDLCKKCSNFYAPLNGYYRDLNVPYIAAKNLINIDANLSENVINYLNKKYDKEIIKNGKTSDFCQRYLNYPIEYVNIQLRLLNNYLSSLNKNDKCVVSEKLIKEALFVKNLLSKEYYSQEEINELIKRMNEFSYYLSSFCDDIEISLKSMFSEDLKNHIEDTRVKLKEQKGKIKILDGQKFDILIHCACQSYLLDEREKRRGFSTTLINDENICCYRDKGFKFAFYNINDEDIVAASATDNYSTSISYDEFFHTTLESDYLSIRKFKEKTNKKNRCYNEINIANNSKITPSALVCFDDIKLQEYELAGKYDLDIILVKTKFYPNIKRNKNINR